MCSALGIWLQVHAALCRETPKATRWRGSSLQSKCPGASASFQGGTSGLVRGHSIHHGITEMGCRRKISAPAETRGIFASHLSRAGTQASKVLLPEAELLVPTTLGSAWKHLFDLLSIFLCRCLAGGPLCSREGRILHLGQHGPGNLQEEEQEGDQGEVCGTIIFGQ